MSIINLKLSEAKKFFFDRKAVVDAVGRATAKNFGKAGSYIMTTARQSIRRRKKSAAPGTPPSNKTGTLKRSIFFAYDPERKSLVTGPILLNKPNCDALEMLEVGGVTTRKFFVDTVDQTRVTKSGKLKRKSFTQIRSSQRAVSQTVHYQARPFMLPAYEKNKAKIAEFWRDSVKP